MTSKKIITIGIDARLAGQKNAGLGRYINNLLLRLPFLLPNNFRLVYFLHDKSQWGEIIGLLPTLQASLGQSSSNNFARATDILAKIKLIYTPIRHYSLAEQTQLPAIFAAENLDLLHVPHFNAPLKSAQKQNLILTIHDLLWHQKKGLGVTTLSPWKYYLKYLGYRFLTSQVIKKAQAIITVSTTAQKDLNHYYPRAKDKISLIYNGVNPITPAKTPPRLPAPLPANFLLYVGSLYPHKNLPVVLDALASDPTLHLVIVSARDAFWQQTAKQIQDRQIEKQITFMGQVSDTQLNYLYTKATVLVQPSLSEGFGLTGIEALAAHTPVIASNIPVFQEIYGAAFTPFDPYSSAEFFNPVQKYAPRK